MLSFYKKRLCCKEQWNLLSSCCIEMLTFRTHERDFALEGVSQVCMISADLPWPMGWILPQAAPILSSFFIKSTSNYKKESCAFSYIENVQHLSFYLFWKDKSDSRGEKMGTEKINIKDGYVKKFWNWGIGRQKKERRTKK